MRGKPRGAMIPNGLPERWHDLAQNIELADGDDVRRLLTDLAAACVVLREIGETYTGESGATYCRMCQGLVSGESPIGVQPCHKSCEGHIARAAVSNAYAVKVQLDKQKGDRGVTE